MKNSMKLIAVFLCIAGLAMAVEYTDWQKGAIEGIRMGFGMGQSYQLALEGNDINGYNARVDNYNAWVRANFGEDATLLMQKMANNTVGTPASANATNALKPTLVTSDTGWTGGIVHELDGSWGKYTTGDMNTLPDDYLTHPETKPGNYLPGV